jgi:hypothetical protein
MVHDASSSHPHPIHASRSRLACWSLCVVAALWIAFGFGTLIALESSSSEVRGSWHVAFGSVLRARAEQWLQQSVAQDGRFSLVYVSDPACACAARAAVDFASLLRSTAAASRWRIMRRSATDLSDAAGNPILSATPAVLLFDSRGALLLASPLLVGITCGRGRMLDAFMRRAGSGRGAARIVEDARGCLCATSRQGGART